MEPERAAFLAAQLAAIETTARRLSGQSVAFDDEVRATFDLRIAVGDPEAYRAAHRELDALLPGTGPLAARLAAHRDRERLPQGHLGAAVRALSAALRERTAARIGLPAGESVGYRLVGDTPWAALHQYRGGLRSVVTVNVAGGLRPGQLVRLVAHEAYPGHHTERCRKEVGPVARGWIEHAAVVVGSPQSTVAEGAADLGLRALVGPGWGMWAQDVLAAVGVRCDGELAERVDTAVARLASARLDAALMLHGRKAPPAAVVVHLRRWALLDAPRATRVVRFLRHPLWRAYTAASVAGPALVGRWWRLRPGDGRLCRLLDEPLTPTALRRELAAEPIPRSAQTATGGMRPTTSGRPLC